MTSFMIWIVNTRCMHSKHELEDFTISGLLKVIYILATILIQSLNPFWAKCHMSLFVITWNIYKIPSSLTKLASKQEAPKVPNLLITYIVCEPLNLLWSNFLIGHPLDTYLWIINDKAQKGHQKHIFLDEMGCMFNNIDTNLSSIANWNGRTYVFTSRERECLLASESSPTPKLDKTIYIICNCWLNENLIPGPI